MSILERFPDVLEVQAKLEESFCTPTRDLKGDKKNIFDAVLATDDDLLKQFMGQIGIGLKSFAKQVDRGHPTVEFLHDGAFLEGSKFFNDITDAIVLAECARGKDLRSMPAEISDLINSRYGVITRLLLKPPPSMLNGEKARESARSLLRWREIDLSSHYSKAGAWESVWPSFKPYARLGEGFKARVEYQKKLIQRLGELSATSSAEFLARQNESLMAASQDSYCGFVRLPLNDAAITLAKVMEFDWSTELGRIVVSKDRLSIPISDERWFLYTPRIYPLPKYPATLSEKMKDLVGKMESHPDSGGKPLFDLYWVIVPSIAPRSSSSFHDGVRRRQFGSIEELYGAIDARLIEAGDIVPVLMGENVVEHKCYFLSYVV